MELRFLVISMGIAYGINAIFPALPVQTPVLFAVLSVSSAVLIGLVAGVMPARRAAMMDPVEALRAE